MRPENGNDSPKRLSRREAWRNAHVPWLIVDMEKGVVLDANRAAESCWGYAHGAMTGRDWRGLFDEEAVQACLAAAQQEQRRIVLPGVTMVQRGGARHVLRLKGQRIRPRSHPEVWSLSFEEIGKGGHVARMRRTYWAMGAYARSAAALMRSADPLSMMHSVCEAIIEQEAYRLAVVAMLPEDGSPWLEFQAVAGRATAYLEGLSLTACPSSPDQLGPAALAFTTGIPQVVGDTHVDPRFVNWRERARLHGIRSLACMPVRRDGAVTGVLLVYAGERDAFGPQELNLIRLLAEEISFAIALEDHRRHAREMEAAQREADLRARAAREALQRASRVSIVGELSAAIAHEVNQPLGAIVTNAQTALRWLEREKPDIGEAQAALGRLLRDARRAVDVLARTRAMYMAEGTVHLPFNLHDAAAEVLLMTRERRLEAGVRLSLDVGRPGAVVEGDRVQIQQVIFNLVINALEAMESVPREGRALRLAITRQPEDVVRLSVGDTGAGLAPSMREHVFERFHTTKKGGTGLGLSLSRRIVEAHAGRLSVESPDGGGAIFHLDLPLMVGEGT